MTLTERIAQAAPLRLLWDARLARLLARSQTGDRDAFRELYRALYPPVCRFVSRRCRVVADAEDVVGQVFFQLLEALPRIDPRKGTALAYALSMARNVLVDRGRTAGRWAGEELAERVGDGSPGALERLLLEERLRGLRRGLSALPADTRELLTLRFVDGLRHRDLAVVLGTSEAAVRQRVSRALRELRGRLGGQEHRGGLPHDA